MEISCPQCEHPNPKDAKFCKECGLQLARSTDPLLGQKIGNHRLVKRIGVGGMGVVYLAEHVNLGKKYAVKFLHPQFASDEEVVARFRREAKVIAALDHENIIRENDFGWLDGVGFYLIMEYLEGETLKEKIKNESVLRLEDVIRIFEQLMDALDEAHSQGVVHRDLKPENIFLVQRRGREQLKILDFGIASVILDGGNKDFTMDGEVYGSPTYMSPEQARGEMSKVDYRSDLYAVGIILVEVLTGRPPYKGSTPAEVMLAHISGLPPQLSDLNPDQRYAPGLEDFVFKALAKESDERFQSANEFWTTLRPMLERTKELQSSEIDETVDIQPAPSPIPSSSSSARVLVSREWTPTPSDLPSFVAEEQDSSLSSETSLAGSLVPVPVSAIDGKDIPSPTAEMRGFESAPLGPSQTHEQIPVAQEHQRPFASSQHISTFPSDTPAPLLPPHNQTNAYNESGQDAQVNDFASVMSSFEEEDDDEATTVSLVSSPTKNPPTNTFSGPSTVSVSPNAFSIDTLEPDEKTKAAGFHPVPQPQIQQPRIQPQQPQTQQPPLRTPTQDIPMVARSGPYPPIHPGSKPPLMGQTQSQSIELPRSQMDIIIKHPAFLGGVVGFVLLLVIWALLPSDPNNSAVPSDAGSTVIRGTVSPLAPDQRRNIYRSPPRIPRRTQPVKRRRNRPRGSVTSVKLIRFTILSKPPGANIIIQGRGKVAVTPFTIQSPKGSYLKIYIQKDGYQSWFMPWRVKENIKQTVRLVPEN